ncbi:MAG: hypothetical protein EOO61_07575 [Hymenobacter sp.]|nr:MAG: hypothetical protein EOO61_07575 [Hymenobacter sp.]
MAAALFLNLIFADAILLLLAVISRESGKLPRTPKHTHSIAKLNAVEPRDFFRIKPWRGLLTLSPTATLFLLLGKPIVVTKHCARLVAVVVPQPQ